eukprot:CAMPEP_0196820402 /NCGR_PEP_ID=MMETSP1362-20130617/75086_1 /TAXON_ID=163516 /ORGANISM="Leptocylindrus danicus, Strain CCMP1856" /LENGTH=349 /DNA_ID=CAMNT_0042199269 /DNA_START=541 /DNA_END=1587 /DNA_ORIENTATION=-
MSGNNSFVDYVPQTIDPGNWLLVATVLFCFFSIVAIPFVVAFGRSQDQVDESKTKLSEPSEYKLSAEAGAVEGRVGSPIVSSSSTEDQFMRLSSINDEDIGRRAAIRWEGSEKCFHQYTLLANSCMLAAWDKLVYLAEMDDEMREVISMATPLTLSGVSRAIFDAISVGLVGNFIGTDAVVAYTVTIVIIGITDSFIKGVPDAENTVCSHALGTGNNYLCGQYVQISIVIYVIYSIPTMTLWCFFIGDFMLWMGLDKGVSQLGVDYTRVVVFHFKSEGIGEAIMALLDVTGHASFGTIIDIVEGLTDTLIVAVVVTTSQAGLTTIALIHLGVSLLSLLFALVFSYLRGW